MKIIEYTELTPELAAAGCLVLNMPNDAYHTYAGISKSGLDLIDRSPAHFAYKERSEATRAMVIGSALHSAVLEPESFNKDYMLLRDVTDKRASAYKEAVKVHGADYVLTGKEADSIIYMQQAINNNLHASALLDAEGWAEVAVFATDPETGTLVKCKFDKLLKKRFDSVDLKTTQDLRDFNKSVANYRYHVQAAFYSDVFEWATGLEAGHFDFLAVEKDTPCISRIFRLDTAAIQYGRKLYRQNLNTYAECLKNNEWPMPDGGLEYICLPYWAADPDMEI
jgi:exodeoxyribonuclease VIII